MIGAWCVARKGFPTKPKTLLGRLKRGFSLLLAV